MAEELSFVEFAPDQGKKEELSFVEFAPDQGKAEDLSFVEFAPDQDMQPQPEPQGLYGPGIFPGYEPRKPEPTREALAPMPYMQAYPAGLVEAGRRASKLIPPVNWYIEKSIKELPESYKKKWLDHPIAKTYGGAMGEMGKYGALILGGQTAGLFAMGPKVSAALAGVGMAPKIATFIGAGAPGGLIHATATGLGNLSDVMSGTKEPDITTLLWEPAAAGAFGQIMWGGQVMGGVKTAIGMGGAAFGARTAAPYIAKMWQDEDPNWKALASDMAISVPLGMFIGFYGHKQTADAFMKATKNYMVEHNADFIQANADIIKKNPESFMFATKYKGRPVQWGFQPEVQDIIKSGQADLTNRKTALSLSRKIVDHFFAHPSPQIQGDFSGLSNIIKNSPKLIDGMTKDIQGGMSPTVALMKNSTQTVLDNPDMFANESKVAQNFANQILGAEKNINKASWGDIVPAWAEDIKPEYQQLIESSKTLLETNNSLIKKYEQAKFVGGISKKPTLAEKKEEIAARREEFAARIEELKKDNIEIKKRLKQYGFQPATHNQKGLAHRLVQKSGMSEKEWFGLKQELTGTDSMATMSKQQANAVIDALSFGPKKAKVPLRQEPVFKKPTLAQWPTSKHTYAKVLGLGPIMDDLFIAEVNRSLEYEDISKFANDVSKQLRKQASLGDRLASKVMARPTKPEQWMADLLVTYESPADLPDIGIKNAEIFTKVRDLTKSLLARENAVNEILGREPIRDVKAYLPRVFDQITKAALNEAGSVSIEQDPLIRLKDLDISDDMKDWLKPRMPRKPFNPTEFARKTKDEFQKYWSRDLNRLIKHLGYYATREIHLSEPLEIFKGQLEHYADLGVLPEETKDWAEAVVKYDIFKHPTAFEKATNNTFKPVTDLINHVLHPINRHLSDPVSAISRTSRKLVIASALAGRPKMPIRNAFQRGLLLNLYPAKHFMKAQLGLGNITPDVKQKLKDTWIYRISNRFEDAPDIKNKLLQWGMMPYRFSHAGLWFGEIPISNIDVALSTGYLAGEELRTAPRYIKWAEQKAAKEGRPKDFYKRTPQDSIEEAIRAAEYTQFVYHTAFMPQYFRGQIGRFFGSLTSWQNFFNFTHNRELLHVLMKGESYNGKPYPPYYRARSILGYATFLGTLEGLRKTTGLDYTRFYLGGPGAVLNPMARFSLGAIMYTTSKSNYDRNYGKYLMKSSAKLFTGFGLAGEEWRKWMTGEISTKEFFTFTNKKRKGLGKMF